ncbi:MAG TPA: sulfatase-like hydrolase/transferase [Coriobacteriia bacterium]|nr:sulfatase-like hydrolase/transferase [Coriobacteriia bacterium]
MSSQYRRGSRETYKMDLQDRLYAFGAGIAAIASPPTVVGVLLAIKVLAARRLMLGHIWGMGFIADVLAVVAVVALSYSFGERHGRRTLAVLASLISVALVIGVLYESYFDQVPALGMLALAKQALSVGEDASALFTWRYLLFLADLPVILFAAFAFDIFYETEPTDVRRQLAIGGASLAVVALFGVNAFRTPDSGDTITASYRHGIVGFELSSLVPRHDEATEKVANSRASILQAQIDETTGRQYGGRRPLAPNKGAFAGKNLIMIQVEALQAGCIGASINGQEVTPNLNRLVARGLYFPNTYSQIGRGNTSDAEFMSNTSLYPCEQQASSVAYATKELPSLPRLLNDQGYDTFTLHTNDPRFWNRFQLYPALGFNSYYDNSFFGDQDFIAYGASDYVLFDKGLNVLIQASQAERPFYAQFVTTSSHYPFREAAARGSLMLAGAEGDSQTGQYLRAMSYADEQIGWFMERLEMAGLVDNSIIVVYGDHFGMRYEGATDVDLALRRQLLGHNYSRAEFFNIPLIVLAPGQQPRTDRVVLGQIDIMPTVCDMLGVDLAETPHFGRSAFDDTPTLLTRPSSMHLFIDDQMLYLAGVTEGEDRWYSPVNQVKRPGGSVPALIDNTTSLLHLSDAYVRQLPEREGATGEIGRVPYLDQDIELTPFR